MTQSNERMRQPVIIIVTQGHDLENNSCKDSLLVPQLTEAGHNSIPEREVQEDSVCGTN